MNISNILKYANGFQANDRNLKLFFQSAPACVYYKDITGKYLDVNDLFLHTNAMSSSDILGKKDIDLPWRNEASLIIQNDKKIITTEMPGTFIENALSFGNQIRYFLSHKLPLLNRSGKIIGTIGSSFLLDSISTMTDWLKGAGFLINYDPKILMDTKQKQQLTQRQMDLSDRIRLLSNISLQSLSPRQKECLNYLTTGMTIKQIARKLALSPRTVEHHIEATVVKLGCSSRKHLIETIYEQTSL